MTLDQIEQVINDCLSLIKVDAASMSQARERAAKFLAAQAILVNYMKDVETELGKHETVVEVAYSQAIRESTGKNITEKKAHVIDNHLFRIEKDKLVELEAKKNWLKTHIKVLENAHLMFRQFSRE